MRIAVNTRFLFKDALEGVGVYTDELLRRMALTHSHDHFDFYFDRSPSESFKYADNVELHWFRPQARHPLLFHVWYQQRLRPKLEKSAPDLFWSPDGFMPTGLSMPAVITIHDVAYARYPDHISSTNLRFYRQNMPRFVSEASHILTVSEFSKREICEVYDVVPERVTAVYNGVSQQFKPLSPEMVQEAKEKFAGGRDYFLYVGAIHPRKNILNLIRAYEMYRSTSSHDAKLIITGRNSWKFSEVTELVEKSQFKSDIQLTGYVPDSDLPELIGGATALTYVSLYEGFGLPVANGMASGVPVVVSAKDSTGAVLSEVAGDAGYECDPVSPESISQAMQLVVTDGDLRNTRIEKGIIRSKEFDWSIAADKTYTILREQVSL